MAGGLPSVRHAAGRRSPVRQGVQEGCTRGRVHPYTRTSDHCPRYLVYTDLGLGLLSSASVMFWPRPRTASASPRLSYAIRY